MSSIGTLEQQLAQSLQMGQKNAEAIDKIGKAFNTVVDKLARQPMGGTPAPGQAFGVPWVRNGEDPMSSRGLSFLKYIGLLSGACDKNQAKFELDMHRRMNQCLFDQAGGNKYEYGGNGHSGVTRFLAPLATSYFQDEFVDRKFRNEMKSMVMAGVDGADWDEMRYMRTKQLQGMGYNKKALSWLNEVTGGAIVAPPEMGELIELLRNKEALVNAGARVVPLPPQGRLKYPKQTAASTTYWVGENAPITESIIGTGEVTLQGKKLAVLIKAPNELIRFASPAAEALLRDDMTKSLALGLDLAGLQGSGTDTQPRGIINMPGVYRLRSSKQGVTTSGDVVVGQDIYRMIAAVEEQNAEFEAFIMRPKTLYKYYQLRADAAAANDAAGPFLFNLIREAQDDFPATLAGYPVVKSTQVNQTMVQPQTQATNLTYVVGGMWSDLLIGMFGAIEFAATTQGDSSFVNDQTWVRGILTADIQARHEGAFVLLPYLDTTLTAAS